MTLLLAFPCMAIDDTIPIGCRNYMIRYPDRFDHKILDTLIANGEWGKWVDTMYLKGWEWQGSFGLMFVGFNVTSDLKNYVIFKKKKSVSKLNK